nr:MAG TPA: DNA primase [Caudoviricetes sp.]
MVFSQGKNSFSDYEILQRISETELAAIYLNIIKIPCTIKNPMRRDENPSLGWYATNSGRIKFRDFATNEKGTLLDFLCMYWKINKEALHKKLLSQITQKDSITTAKVTSVYSELKDKSNPKSSTLQVKIRKWAKRDIEYWESFGVPLNWLQWAEVYPISHTIITIGKKRYVFGTDPLAYVFVEHKEGNTTLKVYQPYNTAGRKWLNKNDKSVIGLWTKVPPTGKKICICASLKDSLCLSANTGIPTIYIQGEGYSISKTACNSLKDRYEKIYILLDNDETGLKDAKKLAEETGFINLELPKIEDTKDISDVYHKWQDKNRFKAYIKQIINF